MNTFKHYFSYLSPNEMTEFIRAMDSQGNRTGYTLEQNLERDRNYDSFADFIDTIFRWSETPQGQQYWEGLPNKYYRVTPWDFRPLRWSATDEYLRIDDLSKIIGRLRKQGGAVDESERLYLLQEDIETGLFKKIGNVRLTADFYGYEYALKSDVVNIAHFAGGAHSGRHYNVETRYIWEGVVKDFFVAIPEDAQEYDPTAGHNFWPNGRAANSSGYTMQDGKLTRCADIAGLRPAFVHYKEDGVKFAMIPQDLKGFMPLSSVYDYTANDSTIIKVIEGEEFDPSDFSGVYAYDYNDEIVDDAVAINCGIHGTFYFSEQFIENTREITLGGLRQWVGLIYTDDGTFLNTDSANYCNWYYCSDCSEWYDAENCGDEHDHSYDEEEDENDSNNPRFGYHSCEHYDYSEGSEYKVGFEIEKECEDGCAHSHYHIRSRFGWVKERDGSLDDEIGFELVTPQYDLFSPKLMEDANKIEEAYPKLINGAVSSSCGGHVHFSKAETMGSDLLESICGYLPILYSIYEHRINKSFCEVKEKEEMKRSDNKYQAVKVMRGRIEFRIFPAVKNLQVMEWRVDLIRIMAKNPSANPLEVIKTLTNSRTELHKHFAKIFSRGAIYRKAQKALEYAKKFDSNYFNVDMRADVRAINKKVSRLNKADAKKMEALAKELSAFAESIN
jgi:hypothetical protein